MKNLVICLAAVLALASCSKEPGDGGNSTLEGTVNYELRQVLVNPGSVVYEGPAQDWDVYLVYGDNIGFDDRTRTDYNGRYKFEFLREGEYTVYAYSQDTINGPINNGEILDLPIIQKAEITGKKQTVEVPEITVYEQNN